MGGRGGFYQRNLILRETSYFHELLHMFGVFLELFEIRYCKCWYRLLFLHISRFCNFSSFFSFLIFLTRDYVFFCCKNK
jgi:hypothetical protein